MPFPEADRVIFGNNPLEQVICQLRFPAILRIDTELPVGFQEKVCGQFPTYAEKTESQFESPPELRDKFPAELIVGALIKAGPRNYSFTSEDELHAINLTRTFVAVSTRRYTKWEDFKSKIELALEAIIGAYDLTAFSRIGLRYIDIIQRSSLDLDDVRWDSLIKPFLLGFLAESTVKETVFSHESLCNLNLADGKSSARILSKLVNDPQTDEECFVIDSDFFVEGQTGMDEAFTKLDYFNVRSSRFIQWCITDELRSAMKPAKL